MQYILNSKEFDALTEVTRLQNRNQALEVARKIILELSGFPCGKKYCSECPIVKKGDIKSEHSDDRIYSYICTKPKSWPK